MKAKAAFPISATVARFVDRLTGLSSEDWNAIQKAIGAEAPGATMLEASRNAAVALAVRDLISNDQFELLYGPFVLVIPIDTLDPMLNLD